MSQAPAGLPLEQVSLSGGYSYLLPGALEATGPRSELCLSPKRLSPGLSSDTPLRKQAVPSAASLLGTGPKVTRLEHQARRHPPEYSKRPPAPKRAELLCVQVLLGRVGQGCSSQGLRVAGWWGVPVPPTFISLQTLAWSSFLCDVSVCLRWKCQDWPRGLSSSALTGSLETPFLYGIVAPQTNGQNRMTDWKNVAFG